MGSDFSAKDIPLPKSWASGVKAGVVHAISLAHLVIIYARGWAANSRNARIRLAAERKEAKDESAANEEQPENWNVQEENLSPLEHYTPHSFYEKFVGTPLADYVCLYNDPQNEFGKHYCFSAPTT